MNSFKDYVHEYLMLINFLYNCTCIAIPCVLYVPANVSIISLAVILVFTNSKTLAATHCTIMLLDFKVLSIPF